MAGLRVVIFAQRLKEVGTQPSRYLGEEQGRQGRVHMQRPCAGNAFSVLKKHQKGQRCWSGRASGKQDSECEQVNLGKGRCQAGIWICETRSTEERPKLEIATGNHQGYAGYEDGRALSRSA